MHTAKKVGWLLLAGALALPAYADIRRNGHRGGGHARHHHHARVDRDHHGHWGHKHHHRWRGVHRHHARHHVWAYGWSPTYHDWHYRPGWGVAVYDDYTPAYRTSRAVNGLLLGGLAGAVIGNNSGDLGHNAWRGAAYGALGGYVLGAIADRHANNADRDDATTLANEAAVANAAPATISRERTVAVPRSPAPVVTSSRVNTSSMTSANRLFGR